MIFYLLLHLVKTYNLTQLGAQNETHLILDFNK
jgi:hypothetical protein